ncbi:Uncharacterized protein Adt_05062 [Abeliophyllum distichum]|uniref:Uncharacterized protein n=1 Tax=Abeliophyllum distichum TaxID=126358 RepID=A0ABD1V3E7_9LAMI
MFTSTFDASGSGKGNKTKQPKPTRTSAQWDPEAKRVFISLCEEEIIAGRRPGSHFTPEGIDPVTNTIDAPSEWWDRKIKEHDKYRKFRGRDVSLFQHHYPTLFEGISATGAHLRTPSTVSQVGANSSAPSQAEDYQDADPDEGEGSDESNGPVNVPNCQMAMSQEEEIGRGTSSGKRK